MGGSTFTNNLVCAIRVVFLGPDTYNSVVYNCVYYSACSSVFPLICSFFHFGQAVLFKLTIGERIDT